MSEKIIRSVDAADFLFGLGHSFQITLPPLPEKSDASHVASITKADLKRLRKAAKRAGVKV